MTPTTAALLTDIDAAAQAQVRALAPTQAAMAETNLARFETVDELMTDLHAGDAQATNALGCELDRRIAAGDGTLLFRIRRPGPAGSRHSHELRIMSLVMDGHEDIWVDLSEPGGCGCNARMTLAQMCHALINLPRHELLAIEAREVCPLDHPHHGSDTGQAPDAETEFSPNLTGWLPTPDDEDETEPSPAHQIGALVTQVCVLEATIRGLRTHVAALEARGATWGAGMAKAAQRASEDDCGVCK